MKLNAMKFLHQLLMVNIITVNPKNMTLSNILVTNKLWNKCVYETKTILNF